MNMYKVSFYMPIMCAYDRNTDWVYLFAENEKSALVEGKRFFSAIVRPAFKNYVRWNIETVNGKGTK